MELALGSLPAPQVAFMSYRGAQAAEHGVTVRVDEIGPGPKLLAGLEEFALAEKCFSFGAARACGYVLSQNTRRK